MFQKFSYFSVQGKILRKFPAVSTNPKKYSELSIAPNKNKSTANKE
jgi:hypothetical protein